MERIILNEGAIICHYMLPEGLQSYLIFCYAHLLWEVKLHWDMLSISVPEVCYGPVPLSNGS